MIRTLGALVGAGERAGALAAGFEARLAELEAGVPEGPRPRVYIEEWDDPPICGIRWVSEPDRGQVDAVQTVSQRVRQDGGRDRQVLLAFGMEPTRPVRDVNGLRSMVED